MKRWACCALVLAALGVGSQAQAFPRDRIEIVATPGAFALAARLAKGFAATEPFAEPSAEALSDAPDRFCSGVGLGYPDVAIAERELSAAERRHCRAAGVTPVKASLGYAGLVVLEHKDKPSFRLTPKLLFLALAKDVPSGDEERLVPNPYTSWDEIDSKLPKAPIEVYGPARGSADADALGELAMAAGARSFVWLKALESRDHTTFHTLAGTLRASGAYKALEPGDDPAALLNAAPTALAIEDLTFENGRPGLAPVRINGALPGHAAYANGSYPLARKVWLFVKREHVGIVPGLKELLNEAVGNAASGPNGYLRPLGLVSAPQPAGHGSADTILSLER